MTKVRALTALFVSTWLLTAVAASAQESGSTKVPPYLRLDWQLESTRGQFKNFCGRVYNDREVPARGVVILFEGLDGDGQPVSRRFGEVIGDVQPASYSIFCLMVPAKGTTYRVSVPRVDWGGTGQSP